MNNTRRVKGAETFAQGLTLQELVEFLKKNNSHIKGKGDGSIKWIQN